MSWKWKIAVGIGIALAGLLCLFRASFHLTREQISVEGTYLRTTTGQVMPWFCRRIAIVGPEGKGINHHLQAAVIKHLEKKLADESLVHENFERDGSTSCHENSSPKVTTYSSVQQAAKAAPDLILIIKPAVWQYSMFPFSRNWKARVEVEGKQIANLGRSLKDMYADNTLAVRCEIGLEGKTTGIFSTSYLTSKAGQSAAESITKYMVETMESLAEDYEKQMREADSENDQH